MVSAIPAVLDSTCLIGLENIRRLDLVPRLISPALAPPAVEREFGRCPDWLEIQAPSDAALIASLGLMVDSGEAAAIALAIEKRCRIILDDRKARDVALRLGVPVTGTVGLLIKAKQHSLIPAIEPLLAELLTGGFHLAPTLMAEALRLSGE